VKNYIVYDMTGKITGHGQCSDSCFSLQEVKEGESIIEGIADDVTQKIVDGEIVNKTPGEIEADKPPESKPIPFEQRKANITNEQWKDVIDRLTFLEKGVI